MTHDSRLQEWREFSQIVENHITTTAIPLYGDMPDDPVTAWDKERIFMEISKYTKRQGRNAHPLKDVVDTLCLAHYCAIAFFKIKYEVK